MPLRLTWSRDKLGDQDTNEKILEPHPTVQSQGHYLDLALNVLKAITGQEMLIYLECKQRTALDYSNLG